MRHLLIAAAGIGFLVNITRADVTIPFTALELGGFTFTRFFSPGDLRGSLQAVQIDATLNASFGQTFANDLTVYLDAPPLNPGGPLQVGGFDTLLASEWGQWPSGNSSVPGTVVSGTYTLRTRIDIALYAVYLGNGYANQAGFGLWTGSVTLVGVTLAPPCFGDADDNGVVNFADVSTVLANFGGAGPAGDADLNQSVNFMDITTVLANFGTPCP